MNLRLVVHAARAPAAGRPWGRLSAQRGARGMASRPSLLVSKGKAVAAKSNDEVCTRDSTDATSPTSFPPTYIELRRCGPHDFEGHPSNIPRFAICLADNSVDLNQHFHFRETFALRSDGAHGPLIALALSALSL